jgi:hypothetical protein
MRVCALPPLLQKAAAQGDEPETEFPALAVEELMGSKQSQSQDQRPWDGGLISPLYS